MQSDALVDVNFAQFAAFTTAGWIIVCAGNLNDIYLVRLNFSLKLKKNYTKFERTHCASVLILYDGFRVPSKRQSVVCYSSEDTDVVGNSVLFHLFEGLSERHLGCTGPMIMCHIRWEANISWVTTGCKNKTRIVFI